MSESQVGNPDKISSIEHIASSLISGEFDLGGIITDRRIREYRDSQFRIKRHPFDITYRQRLINTLRKGFLPDYNGIRCMTHDGKFNISEREMTEFCDDLYGENLWRIIPIYGIHLAADNRLVTTTGFLPLVTNAGKIRAYG